jgi:hypothetical protein
MFTEAYFAFFEEIEATVTFPSTEFDKSVNLAQVVGRMMMFESSFRFGAAHPGSEASGLL